MAWIVEKNVAFEIHSIWWNEILQGWLLDHIQAISDKNLEPTV